MTTRMGFKINGKEPTELERNMGCYFVDETEEPFLPYIGSPVRFWTGNSFYGTYRGRNEKGYLVLSPSLVVEFTPFSESDQDKGISKFRRESERPTYIDPNKVICVDPISEEYLEGLVAGETVEKQKSRRTETDYMI